MLRNEGEEVVVECLEDKRVLNLVGFDQRLNKKTDWNSLLFFKYILEILEEQLSCCLIDRVFDEREDESFE